MSGIFYDVLREGISMKYRAIHEHSRCYPTRLMCRTLAVSPAGYYGWASRPESRRSVQNRTLLEVFYSRKRRHSTLCDDSPAEFEARTAVA